MLRLNENFAVVCRSIAPGEGCSTIYPQELPFMASPVSDLNYLSMKKVKYMPTVRDIYVWSPKVAFSED